MIRVCIFWCLIQWGLVHLPSSTGSLGGLPILIHPPKTSGVSVYDVNIIESYWIYLHNSTWTQLNPTHPDPPMKNIQLIGSGWSGCLAGHERILKTKTAKWVQVLAKRNILFILLPFLKAQRSQRRWSTQSNAKKGVPIHYYPLYPIPPGSPHLLWSLDWCVASAQRPLDHWWIQFAASSLNQLSMLGNIFRRQLQRLKDVESRIFLTTSWWLFGTSFLGGKRGKGQPGGRRNRMAFFVRCKNLTHHLCVRPHTHTRTHTHTESLNCQCVYLCANSKELV